MFKVELESREIFEPSTTKVPSISVLSKFEVPSTSRSPLKSAFPPRARVPEISAFPLISIVVAVISTSVGAAIAVTPDPALPIY